MAPSPSCAGRRPKAARTAISRRPCGAAPGTAVRSPSPTSGITNCRSRVTGTRSSARITAPGASMTGVRWARHFRRSCPRARRHARPEAWSVRKRTSDMAARTAIRFPAASARTGIRVPPALGLGQSRSASRTSIPPVPISTGRPSTIRGTAGPTVSGTSSIRLTSPGTMRVRSATAARSPSTSV